MADSSDRSSIDNSDGECISSFYCHFLVHFHLDRMRFFQMFKIDIKKNINMREVIYIVTFSLLCYFFYLSGIQLQTLISFNGAVVGYSYVIVIPIGIHLQCVWNKKSSGYI